MDTYWLTIGAVSICGVGLIAAIAQTALREKPGVDPFADAKTKEKQGTYSGWNTVEADVRPTKPSGRFLRFLSGFFAAWAILAFLYAEIDWDSVNPKDGMIGMGTSAYATVHFARAAALACISVALAILSHGDLSLRGLRLSYRSVMPPE